MKGDNVSARVIHTMLGAILHLIQISMPCDGTPDENGMCKPDCNMNEKCQNLFITFMAFEAAICAFFDASVEESLAAQFLKEKGKEKEKEQKKVQRPL